MQRVPPVDSPEVLERFHAHLPLVDIIAGQLVRGLRGPMQLDDLLSAGREGLLDVARRYDPSHGTSFKSFANYRVKGAMIDQIRQLAPLPRRAYERLAALEAATALSEGHAEQAFSAPTSPLDEQQTEDAFEEHIDALMTGAAMRLKSEAARAQTSDPPEDPEGAYERAEILALAKQELDRLPVEEAKIVRRFYFEEHRLEEIATDLGVSKSWVSRMHTRAVARLATRILQDDSDGDRGGTR